MTHSVREAARSSSRSIAGNCASTRSRQADIEAVESRITATLWNEFARTQRGSISSQVQSSAQSSCSQSGHEFWMKCSARPRGVRGGWGGRRKSVETRTRRDFSRSMWMMRIAGIASRPRRPQGLARKVGIVGVETVMDGPRNTRKTRKRSRGRDGFFAYESHESHESEGILKAASLQ